MLFDEYQEAVQIWRFITPTSGYSDPYWTYIKDITMRIEPFGSTYDGLFNQQTFSNITDMGYSPYEYRLDVLAGDGIVDVDGIQRKVVGQPEWYKYEMPHIEIKMERTQFTVIS